MLLHGIMTPEYSRLTDWLGIWCVEPSAFRAMADTLDRIDLHGHILEARANPQKVQSTLEKAPARDGSSVAIIRLAGTMMKSQSSMGGTSTVQARRDIRQAAQDSTISSILLAIDSPGGTVAGTDDLANEVKMARRFKQVVAHIDDLGASAAYWVASQAEAVYANSPTAMIGSIGTFVTIYDQSEAFAKDGIKALHFATGPLKGAGAQGTELTAAQQAHFQSLINDSQRTFDAAVVAGRRLTPAQLASVRSGGVYLAEHAQSLRLIDGIRPLSTTLEMMITGRMGGLPTLGGNGSLPTL